MTAPDAHRKAHDAAMTLRDALRPVVSAYLRWLPGALECDTRRPAEPFPVAPGDTASAPAGRVIPMRGAASVLSTGELFPPHLPGGVISNVAVGEYGAEYAADLARVSQRLREHWREFLRGPGDEIVSTHNRLHWKALSDGTFWGSRYEPLPAYDLVMLDGIESVGQALAQLTLYAVAGYDNPRRLAHDVVEAQLPERLALWLPLNTLGPMAQAGFVFCGPLVVPGNRARLTFAPEFAEALRHQKRVTRDLLEGHAHRSWTGRAAEGQGCPVARVTRGGEMPGAITRLSRLFVEQLVELQRRRELEAGVPAIARLRQATGRVGGPSQELT